MLGASPLGVPVNSPDQVNSLPPAVMLGRGVARRVAIDCPSAGVCDFPWVNRDRDRAGRLQVQPTSAMPLRAASQASFVEFAVAELSLGYFFDAHFDSSATMFADNPNVENLTTRDGFLIID
jgi:hypothetical protein